MPELFPPSLENDSARHFEKNNPGYSEGPPELESFRDFVTDELEFMDRASIERLGPAQQLALLQKYWNAPASFDHFAQLLETTGSVVSYTRSSPEDVLDNAEMQQEYISYLIHKLPLELRERWTEDIARDATSTLPRLIRAVSQLRAGLLLGFHISPREIKDDQLRVTATADDFSNITSAIDAADAASISAQAKSWYSTDPHHLFGYRARYCYLVEGSRGDIGSPREFKPGHVWSAAPLRIRQRIALSPDTIRLLDLKFDATTNRQQ